MPKPARGTDAQASGLPAQALFEPRSVAVIGVPREARPGQLFLQALLRPGYRGRIYPVNPNAQEILGRKCYPSVAGLPETPPPTTRMRLLWPTPGLPAGNCIFLTSAQPMRT